MIYYTNNRDRLSGQLVADTMKIPLDVLSQVTTLLNYKGKIKRGDITFYCVDLDEEKLKQELESKISELHTYEIKGVDKSHILSISSSNKLHVRSIEYFNKII